MTQDNTLFFLISFLSTSDQPDTSSDGGAPLLKGSHSQVNLSAPLEGCIEDATWSAKVLHRIHHMLEQ